LVIGYSLVFVSWLLIIAFYFDVCAFTRQLYKITFSIILDERTLKKLSPG